MAQTVAATAVLGPGYTGLTMGYRILNLDGTTYSAFTTTGVSETSVLGTYRVANGVVAPDGGAYIVWGVSGTDHAESTIEPAPNTAAGSIADAVWDEATSGHTTAGTFGEQLKTDVDAILVDTNELQTDWVDGGRLDLILDARASQASVDVVDANVDAILADTGTDGVVVASSSKTGYSLSSAGIQAIWDALTSALTTASSIGKLLVDNVNATISSRASQTSVDTIDDFLDTEVAAILADTNELQTDWADGGRLDLILDARASQASVDTLDDYVDTEVAAIKAKTDNLPTDPADASDISASFSTLTTKLRKYVQLLVRKDAAIATDNATEVTEINANGGSGAGAFANTTDALEAIRDRGDAAWITADVSALATQASVDVVDANVDAILADTNELQTDWVNGGRLDNILDARSSQASVDVVDANVDAILADTGTDGVVVTAAMITAIAEAVLKQGVASVENSANEYSLAAMILAHFNSTLPEGGPWTISKVGGGTFVVRTVDEAVVSTAVTGVS